MKTISLSLNESTLENTDTILSSIKKSRNKYINEAIEYYNKLNNRKLLEKKFKEASQMVRDNSAEVLNEFDAIEYDQD